MNEMEEFLNFGAVVKLRRGYDDELYKFIELMKSVGFLKEYAEYFEKNCSIDNEFSEDAFWNDVKINKGNTYDTCIEFQWSKGFTYGNRKEYLDYDSDMKIISVDDLIRACNKEELFKMNYKDTTFKDELQDKDNASDLDDFLDFYEWSIVKYPDGKYNIKDEQCNSFDFVENTTFNKILNRVYFRMFDYFTDEEDIEELMIEDSKYVKKKYESYMKIGENLHLLNEENKKHYTYWFQEIMQEYETKNTIEIND